MANVAAFVLATIVAFCVTGVGADICTRTVTSYSYYSNNYETFYCDYGCCGPYLDEYCCIEFNYAAVVGGVVAGLVVIGVLVAVVVIVKKHNRGRVNVITTTNQPPPPTVTSTVVQSQYPGPPMATTTTTTDVVKVGPY